MENGVPGDPRSCGSAGREPGGRAVVMRTIGILACATALLAGCYQSYVAVPDGDWDVFHAAEDARSDVREDGVDVEA